jgi:tRNA modification GTPase
VSAEAGTTRDVVEASLDIRGYLCSFADTAGIRTHGSTQDSRHGADPSVIGAIEQEGIRRARKKAQDSEVIIVLASVERSSNSQFRLHYDAETLQLAADAQQCLIVVNKCDAVDSGMLATLINDFKMSTLGHIGGLGSAEPLTISCRAAESPVAGLTDPGQIHALTEKLVQSFSALTSLPDEMQHLLGVTERQNQLLEQCKLSLEDFMVEAGSCGQGGEPDVVLSAEHLRLAAQHLAAITGRGEAGDVEDVLGVIFEK